MSGDVLQTEATEDPVGDSIDDGFDKSIPEQVEELLKELPDPHRKAVKAVLLGISIKKTWKAPLPPPEVLIKYNEAFPDAAENIFFEAKKQTEHRMALENYVIKEELRQSSKGQNFGFLIAVLFLFAAAFLAYTGHDTAGIVLGTVDLVALVALFIFGRRSQEKQIENNRQSE